MRKIGLAIFIFSFACNSVLHAQKNANISPNILNFKTNLAAWSVVIANISTEISIGKQYSIDIPLYWSSWHIHDKHALKTIFLQPEGRFWFLNPGNGHFAGVHTHIGWFNLKWNRNRFQDAQKPLLGAGISYGYAFNLCNHYGIEITVGAGYANIKYDTFYNVENGAQIDTYTKNYWGITRIGLSITYQL